ncbi:MAG: response regulator [Thermomicrobiales bacterium]
MATRARQGHILVVNDSEEILELFRDLLEEEGYRVSLYSYALRDLNEVKQIEPDLMILDFLIGGEEWGWQFLQKLRFDRQTASIPVIVCTAAVDLVRELQGHLTEKQVSVILKPFDIDDVLLQVASALGTNGKDS